MERALFVFLALVFLASFISASCSSGQIDLNSATASELDALYGIGPAKAQSIIDYRETNPFKTVDDLINVSGIGPVTLTDIKSQRLACVTDENSSNETAKDASSQSTEVVNSGPPETQGPQIIELKTISLNNDSKDIKTKTSSDSNGSNYAVLGFTGFCVLLGLLFGAKKIKSKNQEKRNEFRE